MNVQAKADYKEILQAMSPLLKNHGFKKKGEYFAKAVEHNFQVICFKTCPRIDELLLTIDVATCSGAVLSLFRAAKGLPQSRTVGFPAIQECQIRQRIGHLMPEHKDKWWEVPDGADLTAIEEELFYSLVQYAFPFLEKHISDVQIRDYLLTQGTNAPIPAANLIVLLNTVGPTDKLPAVLNEARKNWGLSAYIQMFDDMQLNTSA